MTRKIRNCRERSMLNNLCRVAASERMLEELQPSARNSPVCPFKHHRSVLTLQTPVYTHGSLSTPPTSVPRVLRSDRHMVHVMLRGVYNHVTAGQQLAEVQSPVVPMGPPHMGSFLNSVYQDLLVEQLAKGTVVDQQSIYIILLVSIPVQKHRSACE